MRIAALFVLVACTGSVFAQQDWVGKIVPPEPEGWYDVGDDRCTMTKCERLIRIWSDSPRTAKQVLPRYLVAEKFVDGFGLRARWVVTDFVEYPPIKSGYLMKHLVCWVVKGKQEMIWAVMQDEGSEVSVFTNAIWARRLNRTTGKFENLDLKRVKCFNEDNIVDG
jgi:hypothetical protein